MIIVDLTLTGKVKHDGKWYGPGDDLNKVKEEDGKRLIELGVAETKNAKKSKSDKEE
jgi:hypothetical protein